MDRLARALLELGEAHGILIGEKVYDAIIGQLTEKQKDAIRAQFNDSTPMVIPVELERKTAFD